MGKYLTEWVSHGVNLHNPSANHTLKIEFDNQKDTNFLDITFWYDIGGPTRMLVYDRDFLDYLRNFDDLEVYPNLQYAEPGAGLGGFIPHLVFEFGQKLVSKPIVIDPAPYAAMADIISQARELNLGPAINNRLEELVKRAEIIQDPRKVYLINTTLGEALRNIPELRGVADVVVDFHGPANYEWTEAFSSEKSVVTIDEEFVLNLERMLLKPGGKHYVKPHSK